MMCFAGALKIRLSGERRLVTIGARIICAVHPYHIAAIPAYLQIEVF